jgi:hypothetical protein
LQIARRIVAGLNTTKRPALDITEPRPPICWIRRRWKA